MVVDVGLICHVWLRLKRFLHRSDALLVLLEGKEGYALLVEDLWVPVIDSQSSLQVVDRQLILLHVEVALRSVFQKLHIASTGLNRLIKLIDSLVVALLCMEAAAKTVKYCWVFLVVQALIEVFDRIMHET